MSDTPSTGSTTHEPAPTRQGRRSGRRPGHTRTRATILEAARVTFAERGYDRATIRGIARRAAVDPALVIHYFGTKEALFSEALELPLRPPDIFAQGQATDPEQLGATIVRAFLEVWEPPEIRVRLLAMLRSAMTNEKAMSMIRDRLIREIFGPITARHGAPNADLRATLVGSQLVGLAMLRYVARIEPMASASIDEIVAVVAPTLQRYLTGDLPTGRDGETPVRSGETPAAGSEAGSS